MLAKRVNLNLALIDSVSNVISFKDLKEQLGEDWTMDWNSIADLGATEISELIDAQEETGTTADALIIQKYMFKQGFKPEVWQMDWMELAWKKMHNLKPFMQMKEPSFKDSFVGKVMENVNFSLSDTSWFYKEDMHCGFTSQQLKAQYTWNIDPTGSQQRVVSTILNDFFAGNPTMITYNKKEKWYSFNEHIALWLRCSYYLK